MTGPKTFEQIVAEAWQRLKITNENYKHEYLRRQSFNTEWVIETVLKALRDYIGSEDFAVKDGQVMRLIHVDMEKDVIFKSNVVYWLLPPKQDPQAPEPEIKPDYQTAGESWAEADQQPPWRGIRP